MPHKRTVGVRNLPENPRDLTPQQIVECAQHEADRIAEFLPHLRTETYWLTILTLGGMTPHQRHRKIDDDDAN